jgi:arylsulfatase A-like enzyme
MRATRPQSSENGISETYLPNQRGFDHFYGHLQTEVGYFPPFASQGGKDFQRNGVSIEADGYETFLLADEATRWIRERDPSRPFFLYMPFIAPHSPLAAPEALKEKYASFDDERGRPRTDVEFGWYLPGTTKQRRLYAAVVDAMDEAIGRVLDTLDAEGLAENTIVIFFSDNGGSRIYGAGGADNGPLRGGKADTFEGGIRVVAAWRGPGVARVGGKLEQTMSVMDVFPTLAAAAGIETSARLRLDGVDMWPAIHGEKEVDRPEHLFFAVEIPQPGSYWLTARGEQWKLVQRVEQDPLSTNVVNRLFRIDEDPYETNNLAQEHPDIVADLSRRLLEWRSQHPISGTRAQMIPPPGWRAPKDWADYPLPTALLQAKEAPGMVPSPFVGRMLDWMLGDRGRILYEGRDAAATDGSE